MSLRRALLLILSTLCIVGGSYAFAAFRAPGARSSRAVSGDLETTTSAYGQMNTDQLLIFWGERVERAPTDYISMTFLAQAFTAKARETGDVGNYQRAEAALRQALAINPHYPPTLTGLASVLYTQHDFQGALETAQRAYASDPRQVQALATIGDAQLELGRYDDGAATYRTLAEKAPGPAVDSRLAHLAWLRGQTDEAIRLMRQAIDDAKQLELAGENAAWYQFQLGELLFNTGRLDDAASAYTAASALFPNYYLALAGIGKARAAQGRYDEAIASYEHAVASVPQPDYLAALGDLYTLANRPDDAGRQYDTVEFIGKLAAINQVIYNRQLALFRANHDRQLDAAYDLARQEYTVRQDAAGADAVAWTLYKLGRYDEAAVYAEKALALGTRDAAYRYHAGMIYARLGDRARARQYLTEALAINPHFDPLQAPIARQALDGLR